MGPGEFFKSARLLFVGALAFAALAPMGCKKLSYSPSEAPIKFAGIKSVLETKAGSYVVSWDQPAGDSAAVASYEIIILDYKNENAQSLSLLEGESEGVEGAAASKLGGVIIDVSDEMGPAGRGKVFGVVQATNTYSINGLQPGNYGIQVKAINSKGQRDANTKVALLSVTLPTTFPGIESVEIVDEDILIKWLPLVTELKGEPIYYIVYEGTTFGEKDKLALVTADEKTGEIPTEFRISTATKLPGSVWTYGVRVKDPHGNIDSNVKKLAIKIPDEAVAFEGCIKGEAKSSSKIEVLFDFPEKAEQINVYRNGAKAFEGKSKSFTTFTDIGLQEGQVYEYACEAIRVGVPIMGSKKVTVTTKNSNPPTFAGITSASIDSGSQVRVGWGVATGVPANYFAVYATPGIPVDMNAETAIRVNESFSETTLSEFGDQLPYSFGVRACTASDICDENSVSIALTTPDTGPPKTVGATSVEVDDGKMYVTAPWKASDGAVAKRRVYAYIGTTGANNFTNYTLRKTVAVTDLLAPQTRIEIDSLIENSVYNFIVRDEDPTGATSTNMNVVTRNSGDLNPPVFGGITAIALGPVGQKETALTASFSAIQSESAVATGASHYQVYLRVGGGNACSNGTFHSEFASAPYDAGLTYDYTITGLTPRTMYSVCLKSRDMAGNVSATESFLVKSTIDTTEPNFDGIQALTYMQDLGHLKVEWNESTSPDTLEYVVQVWKDTATPDPSEILTLSKAHPAFKDGFNLDKTQFVYGSNNRVYVLVNACDTGGFIPQGQKNCTSFPTTSALNVLMADIDPPPGFAGIAAIGAQSTPSEGVISVNWLAPVDWTDYRGFKVYDVNQTTLDIELKKICPCIAAGCAEAMTSCELLGLDPYRTYYLHVRAYDDAGNLTILDPVTKTTAVRTSDTTAPVFSSNLTAEFNAGATDLTWNSASDNQFATEPGAVITYQLWRKTNTGFGDALNPQADADTGAPLASITSLVHRDGLNYESGKHYYYTVCAVDASNNRTCDGTIKHILTPDLVPPEILTFESNKTEEDKTWNLTWTFSDNMDANAAVLVTVRRLVSPTPMEPDLSLSPIASGYGLTTITGLTGPKDQDAYVNYLLTLEDSSENTVSATVSVWSQNLITVTSVTSSEGSTDGGDLMLVRGTGFHSSSTVTVGSGACINPQIFTKELLMCETPALAFGAKDVVVTNSDGSKGQLTAGYTYCAPGSCTNVCGNPGTWLANFAAGTGAQATPYVICNATHLDNIRNAGDNKYYRLDANIDLSAYSSNNFAPIYTNPNTYAYIYFDGTDHVVANWTYAAPPATNNIGLFRAINGGWYVENVGIVNADVSGNSNVGALIGYTDSTSRTYSKVFATGKVVGTGDNVGGLAGNMNALLVDAFAQVEVTGSRHVGGLVGTKHQIAAGVTAKGTVTATAAASTNSCVLGGVFGYFNPPVQTLEDMTFKGTVSCSTTNGGAYTGGLVGIMYNVTLKNASVSGTVIGGHQTGGLVGHMNYAVTAIEDSFFDGSVSANSSSVGGLVGYAANGLIRRSYAKGTVTSTSSSVGGLVGEGPHSATGEITDSYSLANVSGTNHVGGVVGYISSGIITGSYAKGNVTASSYYVGGFAGRVNGTVVTSSYANGNATSSSSSVGGFVGGIENGRSIITNSYATGKATGTTEVGGFSGYCRLRHAEAAVDGNYATGNATGTSNVGGFCGYIRNYIGDAGIYKNNYATGKVVGTGSAIGGFVGFVLSDHDTTQLQVTRNYATGTVEGDSSVGGFVGYMYYRRILMTENYATGDVTATTSKAGGFVGENYYGELIEISDNYARGNVTASQTAGGFAGYSSDTIRRCYSTGEVTAIATKGGFVGTVRTDAVWGFSGMPNTYFDKDEAGTNTSPQGTPKTTAEMKQQATFINFGFGTIWKMPATDGYPLLNWQ